MTEPLEVKSKSKLCYYRRSVGQSVLLSGAYLRRMASFFITVRHLRPFFMWGALSDERTCLKLQLYWASPVQLFSGRIPAGLTTIFYCLRFETPPTWIHTLKNRVAQLYPQHRVSISSTITTRRATVQVFEPPPHW
jgi:hypothetical protein